jgi:predicted nuclease of restriction endonuclease-like RecB superfamily
VLTADLVNARRRGAELHLVKVTEESRARAGQLAIDLVRVFREAVGSTREDLEAVLAGIEVEPRDQRLKAALIKLLDDRTTWSVTSDLDPETVRREIFAHATEQRASLGAGERFDRARVMERIAIALGSDANAIERALYADLRSMGVLSAFQALSPPALVQAYEAGQAQAVLLRAVRVTIDIHLPSPGAARVLFRKLKFLGLLHSVHQTEDGYRVCVDGPLSLFDSVTRYGQKMALLLPVLDGCGSWRLVAEVRWGKERTPLTFRAAGGHPAESGAKDSKAPRMPDEIVALVRSFKELGNGWQVAESRVVLELPGTGLCVPDLVFSRGSQKIYFEVLGFWSREAVFRRVDLVRRGLSEKILFAVSSRLRVSEEVLTEDDSAGLYVFKGAMNARAVAERLENLARAGTVG